MLKNFINITRVKSPIGILLLLIPCLIGTFNSLDVGVDNEQIVNLLILFTLGSVVMRSAGCIINDICDMKFDKKVARTKNRPLASGKMSIFEALIGLCFLLILGLCALLQLNNNAILCGVMALFLVILYPLMKRITYYPQVFLGVVFNIGFIIATIEVKDGLSYYDLLIYLSLIILTFVYDTIYGFQDIEDDLKIGVKSSAIAISNNPKTKLIIANIFAFFLIFCYGYLFKYDLRFFIFNIISFAIWTVMIYSCNLNDTNQCLKTFKGFVIIGLLIIISFIFKL